MIRSLGLPIVLAFAAIPAAAATLHECKMPDGRTVLLWEPCPDAKQPATPPASPATPPKSDTAPAAKPAPKSSGKAAKPDQPASAAPSEPQSQPFVSPATPSGSQLEREMVIEMLTGYVTCSADIEGFRARNSAAYDFWKLRNAAAIARVQNDPAARRAIERRLADDRQASLEGGADAEKKAYCETLIGPFLQGKFIGTPK